MMKLIFVVILLFQLFNKNLSQTQQKECEYIHDDKTYYCRNIYDVFPNVFYGNYHLQCVKCDIKVFSEKTFTFQNNLISFNASDSGIQYITSRAFSNLGNIQHLYLQNNQIVNISVGAFAGLRQVYELHLENNLLLELQPGFVDDLEANSISLKNNKISELPNRIFDGALSIMTMELQNNKISKLYQDTFQGMDSLEFLELQNNKLCYIPLGVFKHLRTLRHLNLANNKLSNFASGSFSGLKNLQTINLANNSISVFDGSILLPFNHLAELDISGNGIYYLDSNGIRANAPTIRTLRIEDNIFSCPLLANVIQYFKSINVEVAISRGRYEIQNVNGIACIDRIITESISFDYFLKIAEEDSKKYMKYC